MNKKLLLLLPLTALVISAPFVVPRRIKVGAPPASGAPAAIRKTIPSPPPAPPDLKPEQIVAMPELPASRDVLWQKPSALAPMVAFQEWSALPIDERDTAVGVARARERRGAMRALIQKEPEQALANAVPESVRRSLPAEVQTLLEEKIDGRGDLIVTAVNAGPRAVWHTATLNDGREFEAFVYGNRDYKPSREDIPLHGIALDGKMALSQWPGRVLEPVVIAEVKEATGVEPVCPVSKEPVASGDETAVLTGRRVNFYCGPSHARQELDRAAAQEAVRPPGFGVRPQTPQVAASDGIGQTVPGTSSQGNAAWTTGIKRILVVPVRFKGGISYHNLTAADFPAIVNGIRDNFDSWSYGRLDVLPVQSPGSSVTPAVTLKNDAADYSSDDIDDIWKEVKAAVPGMGFTLADYQFLLVLAGNAPFEDPDGDDDDDDPDPVTWGGIGQVGAGASLIRMNNPAWGATERINRNVGVSLHELGHNLGLWHASNIWNPSQNSFTGEVITGEEYGDRYDNMGRSGRDYNARYKQWLGWLDPVNLPLGADGTYLIYEHDQDEKTGVRGLQLMTGDGFSFFNSYHLFIEYRLRGPVKDNITPYVPYDDTLRAYGAQFRIGSPYSPKTWLLDATPETPNDEPLIPGTEDRDIDGNVDAPLLPGRTMAYTRDGETVYVTNIEALPDVGRLRVEVQHGPIPGNDPPTGNISVSTQPGATNQTLIFTANVTDPDDSSFSYHWQIPRFNVSNVRPAVFPNAPSIAVKFPAEGVWEVYCLVSDKHGGTASLFRGYLVQSNGPPTISTISDKTLNEDTSLVVPFTISDPTTPSSSLNVSVSSTNIYLFPFGTLALGGGGDTRTLTMTPPANRHGTATVTITVSDGTLNAVEQFNVTVNPVTPGTTLITAGSSGGNWRYWAQATAPPANWNVGGFNEISWPLSTTRFIYPAEPLAIGVTTLPSVPGRTTCYFRKSFLMPASPVGSPMLRVKGDDGFAVFVNGEEIHRQNLPYGPLTSATRAVSSVEGSAESEWKTIPLNSGNFVNGATNLIAIEVHDVGTRGAGDVVFDCDLSLRTAPTLSTITSKTSAEDQVAGPYNFTAADGETPAGPLTVTATSSNQALVLDSKITTTWDVISGARTLRCTPQPNAHGITFITCRVSDGVAVTERTFTLTITPVNDPPEIAPLPDMGSAFGEIPPLVEITVADADIAAASLYVTAAVNGVLQFNTVEVLPHTEPDKRWLRLVPRPGMAAQSNVTVSVFDGFTTVSDTFVFRLSMPLGATSVDVSFINSRDYVWRYNVNPLPLNPQGQPVDFTAPGFDDGAWSTASAPFGFANNGLLYTTIATPYRITTYFRSKFFVPDPALVSQLKMRLLLDDGAVVYLNGTRIWSSNMPANVTPSTLALSDVSGAAEETWLTQTTGTGLLVAGENTIAVELHQSAMPTAAAPGDWSFGFELSGVAVPDISPDAIIAPGAVWAYNENVSAYAGSDTWASANFVDDNWNRGFARLGYGLGGESTIVAGQNLSGSSPQTGVAFRKIFDIADPPAYRTLHLFLQRDDGAIVLLNGVRVHEDNHLPGHGFYRDALYPLSGTEQTLWRHYLIDPARLIAGRNLIAVAISQASGNGSDLSFDLQLSGDLKEQPTLFMRPVGQNMELSWSAAFQGWNLLTSTDMNLWGPVNAPQLPDAGWFYVLHTNPGTRRFYKLQKP